MRREPQARESLDVLVISHLCPFPTTHGNRSRQLALLSWLKERGFRVRFILQPLDVDDGRGIPALRAIVNQLVVVPTGRAGGNAVRKAFQAVKDHLLAARRRFTGGRTRGAEETPQRHGEGTADATPQRDVDEWCWDATCQEVERASRSCRLFAVFSEYVLFSKCLEVVRGSSLRVIDTTEVFFRNAERFRIPGLAAPAVCSEASEKAALSRADVLIAIQKNDAEALREALPGKRVITVPHTYRESQLRSAVPDRGVVLFVGSSNPFNVHGMREFLEHAWPLVLQEAPFARLQVVGSFPQAEVLGRPGTEYMGPLSDDELARRYQTAHVVINPQIAGTGLKVKCVEALSAGCPLVTMPAGADGIEEGAGRAYLLASDWTEFSKSVIMVLCNDNARQQLEGEARLFAERRFSRSAAFAELAAVLDEHLTRWQKHDADE
jgi:glycosyltransferase involved in cell wall biosynthesis